MLSKNWLTLNLKFRLIFTLVEEATAFLYDRISGMQGRDFLPFSLYSVESSHLLIDLWKVLKKGEDFLP